MSIPCRRRGRQFVLTMGGRKGVLCCHRPSDLESSERLNLRASRLPAVNADCVIGSPLPIEASGLQACNPGLFCPFCHTVILTFFGEAVSRSKNASCSDSQKRDTSIHWIQ